MATLGQRCVASLWWGPLRRPFEAVCRRLLRRGKVVTGPLRGMQLAAGGLAQRLGIYELPVQDAFWRSVGPGCVVYDVGGHLGFFALLAGRRVGPSGHVFVFEPLAECREKVEESAALNDLENVETVPLALGDTPGHADFFVRTESTVASLRPSSDAERCQVLVSTLDEFAADHPAPALVKLDVEGAESLVLEGAREMLATTRPVWLVEIHDGEEETKVEQMLVQAGYRVQPLARRSSREADYPRHVLARPTRGAA